MLAPVQRLQHLLDRPVRADQAERRLGPDPADGPGVVAAAQDAQVDKLVLGQAQLLQDLGVVVLLDGELGRGRGHEVAEDPGGSEGERVHVLGGHGVGGS